MPAPARTAKLLAVPSGTEAAAAAAPLTIVSNSPSTKSADRAVAQAARARKRFARSGRFKMESIMRVSFSVSFVAEHDVRRSACSDLLC
jgi:hypothetical protein